MMRCAPAPRRALAGCLLALFCLCGPAVRAANPPAAPQKVVSLEGITEYRLDNGLRLLLFPDSSTSKVTVNLTVLVGSRHEGYGETGMAHLLEHMLFKGTPTHRDIPRALRDRGADFNGTTSYDRTNYYETLAGNDDNLAFAIRLEADRLVNSLIRREDLASEMTVVRNEFEAGENSPLAILNQRVQAVAYEWHNYGKSTIGNRSDIERVPIERLQAFYRKHYQPDNVVLVVAGNFKPEKALDLVARHFGPLPRPQRRLDATYTEEPAQDGERNVVLRRVGTVGAVGAVYHIPAGAHEDFAPLEVLATLLDVQPSGRLYKALLVTAKKASSVFSYAAGHHDPGIFEVFAQVSAGQSPEAARDLMLGVLEGLDREPVTQAEVDRAKLKLAKQRELLMANSNRVGVQLTEWIAKGDWRLFLLHRDRVAKVTPADVNRVARRYLTRTNRTVGLYLPSERAERAAIPATPDLGQVLKDYKGGQAVAQGESFDPTPENIEKRVRRSPLPGGVKVALLPRKTRGSVVTARLTLRYGNADSLKGRTSATQFLARLMARGTQKHTRQQLEDELDRLKARLTPASGVGEVSFNVQCKRENLPAVLRLLGEVLREPTFPAGEFDVLKREALDNLEKGRTEPTSLASRAFQRHLNPYPPDDVRYVPLLEESIARLKAVTVEQVVKLYADQLGGQSGEFVAVGDFDPEATRTAVAGLLEGWKTAVPYRRIDRPARDVKGARLVIDTPDKASAFYLAGLVFPLRDDHADNPALEVGDFLFGGGPLSSRLANRVRQKEGLSYGVASRYGASALEPSARFLMYAICNPVNMDKVDRAMREELEKVCKEGVDAKELEEAKKAYLKHLKAGRSGDGQLLQLLADDLEAGRTCAYHADLEKKVAALTPQSVHGVFRKYLDPLRLVIIRAGDFKKK